MRLPIDEDNDVAREIDTCFRVVREKYLSTLKPAIEMININVMIGDGSITQVDSFEPHRVKEFYNCFIKLLDGWKTTGISTSKTDDLHRIYCQSSKEAGRYRLTGYFGIQYHALPYFKVDRQVINLQNQLNLIANEAGKAFTTIATKGDQIIQSELQRIGYGNTDIEELIIKLIEDKELADSLDKKAAAAENEFPKFQEMSKKRDKLFSELNNLIVEVYQILPNSIDYDKLIQGEEGAIADISLEKVKNQRTKETDSYVNFSKLSKEDVKLIDSTLSEFGSALMQIESSGSKANNQ